MTRRFSEEPVEEEVVSRLCEVALAAPSAGFAQGVDLLVLCSAPARSRFWQLATDEAWRRSGGLAAGLLAAPVVVVPVADPEAYVARYAAADKAASGLAGLPAARWDVPYWLVDESFVVMQLLLAAEDAGLGALLFRLHAPAEDVLAGLGAPPGLVTVGAVALGRRAGGGPPGSPSRRERRPARDRVHRDGW